MGKISKLTVLVIMLTNLSLTASGQVQIKIKTSEGIKKGYESYNVQYREAEYFDTPIIETNGSGNKLYLYINLNRINEFDSLLIASVSKFKEWVISANQNNLEDIEKVIYTFRTNGSMISDYGYKSGGPCDVEFIFIRKKNYQGVYTHTFCIKSFNSSGPYSAIYMDKFPEMEYDYSLRRNVTLDEKLGIFRQYLDYENIHSQVQNHKNSLNVLN
jgi:hypothetical protein